MTMRLFADRDGFDTLVREDFNELLDAIPFELSVSSWYDAATWAWRNRDIELIGKAFEMFLLNPSSVMGQAHWQRVNLMYQLLAGKASKRDVSETIKTLEVQPMLMEFVNHFLPECEKAGLVDDEIRDQLATRQQLVEDRSRVPDPERKTKSFIKGGN